ncbi:D-serine deaminase-like pyridoxal phosphate-dependent protein [Pedobacter sp. CAN_A7]|uniref:D-TA family PLP-dependent enzyme n=1 Tax=Pedobacter sp. CAN_A7 TaxID=2787722 RepID=UPI0018CB8F1E
MNKSNWYELEDVANISSPGLVFYEDRIQQNINLLIGMIKDKSRLRPHVKTHKSVEVTKLLMAAGLQKFKCATIAEAEMLGSCEAPDVLLAYQPVGPNINRFMTLQERFPRTTYSCLIDNLETAKSISLLAKQNNTTVKVYIDINVGMNRTGVLPGKVFKLYEDISAIVGLKFMGLHAYDGHIHDSDYSIRQQKVNEIIDVLHELSEQVEQKYQHKPTIIAGGTPSFPMYAEATNFECSPGTFALWDSGYQQAFQEQHFLPAAVLMTRIVSLPEEKLICTDLGHKAVSAENELLRRVTFLNAPNLIPISQSEEHLVLDAGIHHGYQVGDVLYGLPHHVCPTVALYDEIISVSPERTPEVWKISSRKRKDTI